MPPPTTAQQVLQGLQLPEAERGPHDRWCGLTDNDYRTYCPAGVTPEQMESFLAGTLPSLATFAARWDGRIAELREYLAGGLLHADSNFNATNILAAFHYVCHARQVFIGFELYQPAAMARSVDAARLPLLLPDPTNKPGRSSFIDRRDLLTLRWMYADHTLTVGHLVAAQTRCPPLWMYLRSRATALVLAETCCYVARFGVRGLACWYGYLICNVDPVHTVYEGGERIGLRRHT
ncbi:uncharacterized protein LOC62_03G005181 [Vanrija pseudolonga]|uniref:Uncharacterized protein n=1 Tax=Vanrija pseudolonga TaxID=143232 RepID=A0AAF1BR34_9TREE|nr:hypothetical protein LOC62_03G005181 [Vanrija pseudolonga]